MSFSDQLSLANETIDWIHSNASNLSIPRQSEVQEYGIALLQHSMDIGDAIVILLGKGLRGPSFTLCRQLFESYTRGVWLLEVVDISKIESIKEGSFPKFNKLISDLEANSALGTNWIKKTAELNLVAFHDLTHGGIEQIARRFSSDAIEQSYSDDECAQILRLQIDVQLQSVVHLLALIGNKTLIQELDDFYAKIKSA